MGIDIVAADNSKTWKQFEVFLHGPDHDSPRSAPPLLDCEKPPFSQNIEAEFFLGQKDGRAVGRVAAIPDKAHNCLDRENAVFFGFFECIADRAVADALLQRAMREAIERGARFLRRPLHPSTEDECGPMTMPYNPASDVNRIGRVAGKMLRANGGSDRPGANCSPHGLLKSCIINVWSKVYGFSHRGAVEELRASGMAAGLATPVLSAGKLVYDDCEMSWILVDNVLLNRPLEASGATRYKTDGNYEWN